MKVLFPDRFKILEGFIILFLSLSFILRLIFLIREFTEIDSSLVGILKVFLVGLYFDIGTISFFMTIGAIYLLLFPRRLYGNWIDKIICYVGFIAGLLIIYFSFFAEITFWDEFGCRFNFIAVDYLIYTYEVVRNINESYPLPLLLGGIGALILITVYLFSRVGIFKTTFNCNTSFIERLIPTVVFLIIAVWFTAFVNNEDAEIAGNRYNNELSKSGIYSFLAAFRSNELSYPDFYETIDIDKAFSIVNEKYRPDSDSLIYERRSIRRVVKNDGVEKKPNIIFIFVESLSAKFLGSYGDKHKLTPVLDSLANSGIMFTNLYATGTRTVRGMEAVTLSIPPTPGRSIVKRDKIQNLYTIGDVFQDKGYNLAFFYGGDGYFDNMDQYFSNNGYNIVDRERGFLPSNDFITKRINIEDDEVTFENAWGVCDEDIYNKVIKEADKAQVTGKPFYDFIMTTSNHRPFTYPDNRIDIPSGKGREGAIKYTDYAIGKFFEEAKTKPWYDNTVFVIMADHCANSAGKWELSVANYHIPCLIINFNDYERRKITNLCSQIDIFPTLFGLLNWSYESNFYGVDLSKINQKDQRAFLGNYRKVGLLKEDKLLVLGDQKIANYYDWNSADNTLTALPMNDEFLNETIAYYQTSAYLYDHGGVVGKK
ncbi:MAG: sulfatase-like hydrolase/transferase [bacterium]